jgi:hypothetical protein
MYIAPVSNQLCTIDAVMLENAILDIAPDDALEMNKKKRMMRWDTKKRKFVKV